ncbi:MAG TPA: hypothetical protein VFQ91_23025 [Bryobacteraceae bacterium]|nr:hypothetical protein [Bryobacteraceae bacterium]
MMLFKHCQAGWTYERLRALRQQHWSSRPHRALWTSFRFRQKAAAALLFQAVATALVALPRGLVRELELEGDY